MFAQQLPFGRVLWVDRWKSGNLLPSHHVEGEDGLVGIDAHHATAVGSEGELGVRRRKGWQTKDRSQYREKRSQRAATPPSAAPTPPKPADQPTKSDKRQLINVAFGGLLLLLRPSLARMADPSGFFLVK